MAKEEWGWLSYFKCVLGSADPEGVQGVHK